jgi:hypothetical protein
MPWAPPDTGVPLELENKGFDREPSVTRALRDFLGPSPSEATARSRVTFDVRERQVVWCARRVVVLDVKTRYDNFAGTRSRNA